MCGGCPAAARPPPKREKRKRRTRERETRKREAEKKREREGLRFNKEDEVVPIFILIIILKPCPSQVVVRTCVVGAQPQHAAHGPPPKREKRKRNGVERLRFKEDEVVWTCVVGAQPPHALPRKGRRGRGERERKERQKKKRERGAEV